MMLAALLLIFSVAFGIHVSFTSPTPMPSKEQRVSHNFLTKAMMFAADAYKYSCWIHCLAEMLVLTLSDVDRQMPPHAVIQWVNNTRFKFLLWPFRNNTTIFFPPLRIAGGFFIISGSTIRYMCYREMGRHFTFHVTLLEKHTLITTGPYSIVRHPSYTATVILNVGIILWHTTSGSWFQQSGLYENTIAWVTVFLPAIIIDLGVMVRPQIEDELLKKEFGRKWDDWAKRVPYRIFPGIY